MIVVKLRSSKIGATHPSKLFIMFAKNSKMNPIAMAISLLASSAIAQTQSEVASTQILPETKVVADRLSNSGVTEFNKSQINSVVGGDGDFANILKKVPGVNLDNSYDSSLNPGDIKPGNISINGAKYYDNQFLLDGTSINSTIGSGEYSMHSIEDTPEEGLSQGLAVDVNLLCSIKVLDSNVSASYGRFLGGVVEAELCKPTKKFGGGFSIEHTKSKWLEKKNNNKDVGDSTSIDEYEKFSKWTLRGNFQSQVSDKLGLVGGYSKKTTEIPLRAWSDSHVSASDDFVKNAEQKIENFYIKTFYKIDAGSDLDFSITASPGESNRFVPDRKNSAYVNTYDGMIIAAGLRKSIDTGVLNARVSYKENESSRKSEQQDYHQYLFNENKNWGVSGNSNSDFSAEGGYGDIEQKEKVTNIKVDYDVNPFEALGVNHELKLGFEVEQNSYLFNRESDRFNYSYAGAKNCATLSGAVAENCEIGSVQYLRAKWDAQFMSNIIGFKAGKFEHNTYYKALYIEDSIKYKSLGLKFGARWEDNSDATEAVISPRFSGFYELNESSDFLLGFGANRYYAQHLKSYQINAKKRSLRYDTMRRAWNNAGNAIGDWVVASELSADFPTPDNLKLPYSDEFSLSMAKNLGTSKFQIKYLSRDSRDEVVLNRGYKNSFNNYKYDWSNSGSSSAKIYSLSWETLSPVEIIGVKNMFSLIFDYQKINRTNMNWAETYLDDDGDPVYAYYNGSVVHLNDLPETNFYRPWTLRINVSSNIEKYNLLIDSGLRIRQGNDNFGKVGDITLPDYGKISKYSSYRMPRTVNFDIKVSKYWRFDKHRKIYADFMIENLFNRSNIFGKDNDRSLFEKGRQFTLRVGYEF